jgi:hypothetical protein
MTFHDAYLVESYRNDKGDPRQRTIAYLGNIREMEGGLPAIERSLFLLRAEQELHRVPDLLPHDRKQLVAQLHQRVPPLSEAEMRVGFHNTLRWYHQWWHDHGDAPTAEEMLTLVKRAGDGLISW